MQCAGSHSWAAAGRLGLLHVLLDGQHSAGGVGSGLHSTRTAAGELLLKAGLSCITVQASAPLALNWLLGGL